MRKSAAIGCAYDGTTTLRFFELLKKNNIDNGYSFLWEPDPKNINKIENNLSGLGKDKYSVIF